MACGSCCGGTGSPTRTKRPRLIAGYRAPYEPSSESEPEPHRDVEPEREPHVDVERPGELVGLDCLYVGRLHDTKGTVWRLSAIDCFSSYASAELRALPRGSR